MVYLSRFETRFDESDKSLLVFLSYGVRNRKTSIARIGSWSDHLEFEVLEGNAELFDEVLEGPTILNPGLASICDHPVKSYRKHLPDWLDELDIYKIDEYHALRLLSISDAALDLYHDNLNLFRILAHRNASAREIGALLNRPHREIVEWLYPENSSSYGPNFIRKWLRDRLFSLEQKMDIKSVDRFLEKILKGEIEQNHPRFLEGIQRIPVNALRPEIVVLKPTVVMNPIDSVMSDQDLSPEEKKRMINDLTENCSSLSLDIRQLAGLKHGGTGREQDWPDQIYQIGTIKGLRKYHDKLLGPQTPDLEDFLVSRAGQYQGRVLPEPWIPGNECIKPLRTFEDFEKESEIMEHCIAYLDYFEKALCGESCYYSVFVAGDRCTLELIRRQDGTCEIRQLRARSNEDPHPATRQLVEKWIDGNSKE